jgi:hypothetical protein
VILTPIHPEPASQGWSAPLRMRTFLVGAPTPCSQSDNRQVGLRCCTRSKSHLGTELLQASVFRSNRRCCGLCRCWRTVRHRASERGCRRAARECHCRPTPLKRGVMKRLEVFPSRTEIQRRVCVHILCSTEFGAFTSWNCRNWQTSCPKSASHCFEVLVMFICSLWAVKSYMSLEIFRTLGGT